MNKSIIKYILLLAFITCIFSFQIKPFEVENIQINSHLGANVACIPDCPSTLGVPTVCQSQVPIPIRVTATIKMSTTIYWRAAQDWSYWIQDKTHTPTYFKDGNCISGQTANGIVSAGTLVTVTLTCNYLPRALQKGDYIYIVAFSSQSYKSVLAFGVPIPGFSTHETIANIEKNKE